MEPLALALLAALTPPDFSITLVDERLERLPPDLAVDVVAITVENFSARRAYQISASFLEGTDLVPDLRGLLHELFYPEPSPHIRLGLNLAEAMRKVVGVG
jgi:hypothetical protein